MFKEISPSELAKRMGLKNIIIIDIRDIQSFTNGRILGSTHIDNRNIQTFMDQTDKQDAIAVCCYHGNSSKGAAQFLFEQGYENSYSVSGGFTVWEISHGELVERG